MPAMTTEERAALDAGKAQLAAAKVALRDLRATCSNLMPIVAASAGKRNAAAIMKMRGRVEQALGILDEAHADAQVAILDGFSDGGDLVTYAPGR